MPTEEEEREKQQRIESILNPEYNNKYSSNEEKEQKFSFRVLKLDELKPGKCYRLYDKETKLTSTSTSNINYGFFSNSKDVFGVINYIITNMDTFINLPYLGKYVSYNAWGTTVPLFTDNSIEDIQVHHIEDYYKKRNIIHVDRLRYIEVDCGHNDVPALVLSRVSRSTSSTSFVQETDSKKQIIDPAGPGFKPLEQTTTTNVTTSDKQTNASTEQTPPSAGGKRFSKKRRNRRSIKRTNKRRKSHRK